MSSNNKEDPRQSRSVNDYASEESLRRALMAVELAQQRKQQQQQQQAQAKPPSGDNNNMQHVDSVPGDGAEVFSEHLDWVLPAYDPDTTEVQSMKEELRRLQTLKKYLILDAEREEAFERITALASRIFNVPIALVSLVDLGRQWFMSNRGLGDVRETPRKFAFCAHAILNKNNLLIVPDATKDFRFRDNPLVTGPPNIRFYAGAPLVSPEGYKLGTFCIIDNKTRPDGMSPEERATLVDLADMTVKVMVDRRYQLENRENPTQLIACAAHDLMTPLTGVQLSLALLAEDEEIHNKMAPHQLELLTTAASCSDLMIRICQTTIDTLRREVPDGDQEREGRSFAMGGSLSAPSGASDGGMETGSYKIPTARLADLLRSLHVIMDPIPKHAALIITLDPSAPRVILSDDLKLFRSALNLLSAAVERTTLGYVHLRIYPKEEEPRQLVFKCEDTGVDIDVEEYQYLFQPSNAEDGDLRLGLSSVASLINSLDGEYGFRPRSLAFDGSIVRDSKGRRLVGSIFWFSIPLVEPDVAFPSAGGKQHRRTPSYYRRINAVPRRGPLKMPVIPIIQRSGSSSSVSSAGKRRLPSMLVGDLLQANAVNESCLNAVFDAPAQRNSDVSAADGNDILDRKMPALFDEPILASAAFAAVNGDASLCGAGLIPVASNMSSGGIEKDTDQQQTASAPTASSVRRRKRRALVIEDSTAVRKMLARALSNLGFDAEQAVDGMQGLEALKRTLFDIVLCDFLMPVMDGLDCVKQYRAWEKENRPTFRQLIIGISAHADVNDRGQGVEAGMDAFRRKPITTKVLSELHGSDDVVSRTKFLDDLEAGPGVSVSSPIVHGVPLEEAFPQVHAVAHLPPSSLKRPVEDNRATTKRPRALSGDKLAIPVCLIATDTPTLTPNEALKTLESNGWKVVVVHDGVDALRLLQMRNWDAVLIDDDIPQLSGSACVRAFREWEERNRINGQKNVILVSDGDIPSPLDESSIILAPTGFDSVLRKPLVWSELQFLLQRSDRDGANIVVRQF